MTEPDSYEAMVFSAHLPNHCIAFIYKDGEPKVNDTGSNNKIGKG